METLLLPIQTILTLRPTDGPTSFVGEGESFFSLLGRSHSMMEREIGGEERGPWEALLPLVYRWASIPMEQEDGAPSVSVDLLNEPSGESLWTIFSLDEKGVAPKLGPKDVDGATELLSAQDASGFSLPLDIAPSKDPLPMGLNVADWVKPVEVKAGDEKARHPLDGQGKGLLGFPGERTGTLPPLTKPVLTMALLEPAREISNVLFSSTPEPTSFRLETFHGSEAPIESPLSSEGRESLPPELRQNEGEAKLGRFVPELRVLDEPSELPQNEAKLQPLESLKIEAMPEDRPRVSSSWIGADPGSRTGDREVPSFHETGDGASKSLRLSAFQVDRMEIGGSDLFEEIRTLDNRNDYRGTLESFERINGSEVAKGEKGDFSHRPFSSANPTVENPSSLIVPTLEEGSKPPAALSSVEGVRRFHFEQEELSPKIDKDELEGRETKVSLRDGLKALNPSSRAEPADEPMKKVREGRFFERTASATSEVQDGREIDPFDKGHDAGSGTIRGALEEGKTRSSGESERAPFLEAMRGILREGQGSGAGEVVNKATGGGQAPPPAEGFVRDVCEQVAVKVARLAGGEGERVKLRLEPPSLGFIEVEIKRERGAIKATLWADQGVTKDLLEKHQLELRAMLESDGLRLEQLDVFLKEDWTLLREGDNRGFERQPWPETSEQGKARDEERSWKEGDPEDRLRKHRSVGALDLIV